MTLREGLGKPIYVKHREYGALASGSFLLAISGFCFFVSWIFVQNLKGIDLISMIGPLSFSIMGLALLAGAVFGFRYFLQSKKVEFYEDHFKLFGYNRDGQSTRDFAYSELSVGDFQISRGSVITIRTEPPISWRLAGGWVKEANAWMPLYAWLRGKTGRQVALIISPQRAAAFNWRLRSVVSIVSLIGAALLLGGMYEVYQAFVLAAGGPPSSGPLEMGVTLLTMGIFALIIGAVLLVSQRRVKRVIESQRRDNQGT